MNNKYTIYSDGGSRGNPGNAAIGVVIHGDDVGKKEYAEFIGQKTNNEAEYEAVVLALKKLKSLIGSSKAKESSIDFYADSELLVKQLNREYRVKESGIKNLFMEVWNLTMDFKEVKFHHILRDKNTAADRLVNQALDQEASKLDI